MKIGIGLPNTIPGTPGETLIGWARQAEEAGFSSLATIDRIAYPSYESLIALAAAAGVTERVGLLTNVLLGPTRNPVLLAKEAASVHQLSGGRLILGLGVGSREDDYLAAGQDFHTRGRRWDGDLETIHAAWRGELVNGAEHPIGPAPVGGDGVPIMIGGQSDKAIERTIRWGTGLDRRRAPPDVVAEMAKKVREAWREAGKDGEPRITALTYFGLSDRAEEAALAYLCDYYGEWGPRIAAATSRRIPTGHARDREAFEDAGTDELFLDPTLADLAEMDRPPRPSCEGAAQAMTLGGQSGSSSASSCSPDSRTWMPHSVFSRPLHRPARSSSPGKTIRVHGAQPMEAKPRSYSGLCGRSCSFR